MWGGIGHAAGGGEEGFASHGKVASPPVLLPYMRRPGLGVGKWFFDLCVRSRARAVTQGVRRHFVARRSGPAQIGTIPVLDLEGGSILEAS